MSSFKSNCQNSISTSELENLFANSISKISAEKYLYCQFSSGRSSSPIYTKLKSTSGIAKEKIENYHMGLGGSIDSVIKFTLERMRSFEWREYFNDVGHDEFINHLFDHCEGYGLVLPVFGPDTSSGLFCIKFAPDIFKNTELQNTLLQWACQLAHYRYVELEQIY